MVVCTGRKYLGDEGIGKRKKEPSIWRRQWRFYFNVRGRVRSVFEFDDRLRHTRRNVLNRCLILCLCFLRAQCALCFG